MASKRRKPNKATPPEDKGSDTPRSACTALVPIRKPGRPSIFTPELALTICCKIAEGLSLRTICAAENMPDKATVLRWVLIGETAAEGSLLKQFCNQYTRARQIQAHLLTDEIFDIADDGSNDWMERELENGKTITVLDHEHVQRSKLRVDTRKWFVSKVLPKIFGDKVSHEVSAPGGGPIQIQPVPKFNTAQEFARWVQEQQKLQSAGA